MPSSQGAVPVDFVVVGAMKAMTTSLLATLDQHPGIAVSRLKETSYFVAETGWRRGPAWYEEQFAHAVPGQVRGEASPQYTFFPVYGGVPARMADVAPDVRLVYLVRDPVQRLVSQWRHAVAHGAERRPLAEAVLLDARYQAPSRYWMQVQQYLRWFPEDQVLVVDADRLAASPAVVLREIVAHVGADPGQAPAGLVHLNAAEGRRQLRPWAARARRHATGRRVERLAQRVHAGAWQRLSTVPAAAAVLPEEIADRLREVFALDVAGLRGYLGSSAPAWTG